MCGLLSSIMYLLADSSERHHTGRVCPRIFEDDRLRLLEDVPLPICIGMYYFHDGASPHACRQ
jgi:hypothetical protein